MASVRSFGRETGFGLPRGRECSLICCHLYQGTIILGLTLSFKSPPPPPPLKYIDKMWYIALFYFRKTKRNPASALNPRNPLRFYLTTVKNVRRQKVRNLISYPVQSKDAAGPAKRDYVVFWHPRQQGCWQRYFAINFLNVRPLNFIRYIHKVIWHLLKHMRALIWCGIEYKLIKIKKNQ